MNIEAIFIGLGACFIYWLGCVRTKIKFDLISIMTPKKYRHFTEIKLYVAKVFILLLLVVIFLE
jgi:hypothetical protein